VNHKKRHVLQIVSCLGCAPGGVHRHISLAFNEHELRAINNPN